MKVKFRLDSSNIAVMKGMPFRMYKSNTINLPLLDYLELKLFHRNIVLYYQKSGPNVFAFKITPRKIKGRYVVETEWVFKESGIKPLEAWT